MARKTLAEKSVNSWVVSKRRRSRSVTAARNPTRGVYGVQGTGYDSLVVSLGFVPKTVSQSGELMPNRSSGVLKWWSRW